MFVDISRDLDHIDIVRIDEDDTWSADTRMARIIHPLLRQFRHSLDQKHFGYPSNLNPFTHRNENDQYEFEFIDDEAEFEVGEALAVERWTEIVDHIIWTFGRIVHDPNLMSVPPEMEDPFNLNRGWIAYRDKIAEGLRLFGEYYFSLCE